MDNDTTKTKNSHLKILSDFRNGKTQILVGTQMIAKGHDFPSVTLVGIIDADVSLYQSSYTACEQTFELITQVAGRAGRADKTGEIYLQTYVPKHYVYTLASYYDYTAFYQKEINLRKTTKYPPFTKILRILITSTDENLAKNITKVYYDKVRQVQADMPKSFCYLGAMRSPVGRIQNKFRYQVLVRVQTDAFSEITDRLFSLADEVKNPDVSIFVEIDPQNLS
jgi:primosomal protein N' (replication factor Y)